jgi:tRNA A37 methylthiotransferase MiaB
MCLLCPEATISTDIIVGFPGESDEDFADTMDVLEKVRFEQLFSFKYSARPHTEAAEFQEQIDNTLSGKRLTRLQARHTEILDEIMDAQLGKIHTVYFDELKSNGRVSGRTDDDNESFFTCNRFCIGTFGWIYACTFFLVYVQKKISWYEKRRQRWTICSCKLACGTPDDTAIL